MKRYKSIILIVLWAVSGVAVSYSFLYAAPEVGPYVETLKSGASGMTLWELIKTGGIVMIAIALLSVGALASAIYNAIVLKEERLAPKAFAESLIEKLQAGEFKSSQDMCKHNDSLIAHLTLAGLEKRKKGAIAVREAIENSSREAASRLWQQLSVLADIATIAPMLGLLGTVVGMIQAFNVIAFQVAIVKPILLAGGVAKAMVTTAAGLIVAIPLMILYSFFKLKLQSLLSILERYTTDIMGIIAEGVNQK